MISLNKEELQKAFESIKGYPDWIVDDLAQSICSSLCKKNGVVPQGLDDMAIQDILSDSNWDCDDSLEKTAQYFNIGITKLLVKKAKPKKVHVAQENKIKATNKKPKELSRKEILRRQFRKENNDSSNLNNIAEGIAEHYSKWST